MQEGEQALMEQPQPSPAPLKLVVPGPALRNRHGAQQGAFRLVCTKAVFMCRNIPDEECSGPCCSPPLCCLQAME